MLFKSDIETNSMVLEFDDNEPFDVEILSKFVVEIGKLNPKIDLIITIHGFVPIELTHYLLNLGKHCLLTLNFINDQRIFEYLNKMIVISGAYATDDQKLKLTFNSKTEEEIENG